MRLSHLTATLVLATLATTAEAELVQADWHRTGDQRAVLDTTSSLRWLDLNETQGQSLNSVESQLNDAFAGWRLPTQGEIKELLERAFNGVSLTAPGIVDQDEPLAAARFRQLFGVTHSGGYSYGLHRNDQLAPGNNRNVLLSGLHASSLLYHEYSIDDDLGYHAAPYGVWLVAGDVAEVAVPCGFGLLGLGGLLLAGRRRNIKSIAN